MPWTLPTGRTRLQLIGCLTLVLGLCAFIALDRTAAEDSPEATGYAMNGDTAYPTRQDDSKAFVRGLEQYNGRMGLMLYELRTWFNGLWQGRALGRTVFVLAVSAAAAVFFFARRLPPD